MRRITAASDRYNRMTRAIICNDSLLRRCHLSVLLNVGLPRDQSSSVKRLSGLKYRSNTSFNCNILIARFLYDFLIELFSIIFYANFQFLNFKHAHLCTHIFTGYACVIFTLFINFLINVDFLLTGISRKVVTFHFQYYISLTLLCLSFELKFYFKFI